MGAASLRSMVMMPVEAEGIGERAVKVSTDLLSSYLAEVPDTSLITAADIKAMVTLGSKKSVFDCDNDINCVAEIGAALERTNSFASAWVCWEAMSS